MSSQLTYEELATLMQRCAGITLDPADLADRPDTPFVELGLDSLGLLAVVGELEQQYGTPIQADAESCKTPRDFVDTVNTTVTTGA
jgi:minimal PKS acyl carrier protein